MFSSGNKNNGKLIVKVALFGSKSRGDDHLDSDIDLLVIVREENRQIQKASIEVGSEVGMKYDVILDLPIISEKRWNHMASAHAALYHNISKEAISLVG